MEIAIYLVLILISITLIGFIVVLKENKGQLAEIGSTKELYIAERRILFQRLSYEEKIDYENQEKGLAYELQIAEYYNSLGYRIESRYKRKIDGGIDVIARNGIETILIQCKNYNTDKHLNLDLIKKFIGDSFVYITRHNLRLDKVKLHFVCSCELSSDLIPNYIKFASNPKLQLSYEQINYHGMNEKYFSILREYLLKKYLN